MSDKRWASARYGVRRRWFNTEYNKETEESVWEIVAEMVTNESLWLPDDYARLEDVLLETLSLPGAKVKLGTWEYETCRTYIDSDSDDMETMTETVMESTSLLEVAATFGMERLAAWVLERGRDLEAKDTHSRSLLSLPLLDLNGMLHVAFRCGNPRVAKMLIEAGADVMARDDHDRSMLFAASTSRNVEVVRFILGLGLFDVEEEDFMGATPLMHACELCDLGVVKALIEEGGADVMARDNGGRNMLFAAIVSWGVGVVQFILGLGLFDVEEKHGGRTPLMLACDHGILGVIKVLVEEGGADVNATGEEDYEGQGALHRACFYDHTEVVQYLVDAGAGAGVEKNQGVWMEALAIATEEGNSRVVDLLKGMGVGGEG